MFVLTFDAASPNISDLSTLSFRSNFFIFVVPLKGSFSRDQLAQFPVAGIYVKAIGDLLFPCLNLKCSEFSSAASRVEC